MVRPKPADHQDPDADMAEQAAAEEHGEHGAGAARGEDQARGEDRVVHQVLQVGRQ